jgi:hypothetical protein
MSFALVRGYHGPPVAAGLTLTTIPIALASLQRASISV